MRPKVFLLLLALLVLLYGVGLGMTASRGDEEGTSEPQSAFAESLDVVLKPFRKPIAIAAVRLVPALPGQPGTSPGVTLEAGRLHVDAGREPRLVRLRIPGTPTDADDVVRGGELVWAPRAGGTESRPTLQSRSWDPEKRMPGPLREGWERTAPTRFDPEQLAKAAREIPFADSRPDADRPLRLAVRRQGAVLDLRIVSPTACTLELRP